MLLLEIYRRWMRTQGEDRHRTQKPMKLRQTKISPSLIHTRVFIERLTRLQQTRNIIAFFACECLQRAENAWNFLIQPMVISTCERRLCMVWFHPRCPSVSWAPLKGVKIQASPMYPLSPKTNSPGRSSFWRPPWRTIVMSCTEPGIGP